MFEWFQHGFMVQALLACAAMGLLLAYLGIHVVGRGIVFVDLGLGQISSMGVAFAGYAGYSPVLCSSVFTLIGAGIFSALRVRDERLRLEAVIGIFYAVSSAATVLLIAKTPHGDADIQDVLFGNVLALGPSELRWMLAVFAVVAVVHVILGKRFFALTYLKGHGGELGPRDHVMNLIFYVLLAMAIVFAIRAGGVIPVFAFLIGPPVAAILLSKNRKAVVVLALAVAAVASFFGIDASYRYDLPAGASIVAVLGVLVFGAALFRFARYWLLRNNSRGGGGAGAKAALALFLVLAAATARGQEPTAVAAPLPDAGVQAEVLRTLQQEVALLRQALAEANLRIAALEQKVTTAPTLEPAPEPTAESSPVAIEIAEASPPAEAPPPASTAPVVAAGGVGGGGLRLIDIGLDGLFSAAASTASEEDLRLLEFGGHDPKNRGTTLQNLELTLSGAVDPYLRGDAYIVMQIDEAGESKLEVEEAFLTTLALPANLQVKAGTFFSLFGRLNPSHPHTWSFADQPVVNSRMFGPDGLRGPGAQLSWLLPTPFFAEATVAVQNGNGETATSFRSDPGEEFAGRLIEERPVRSAGDLLYVGHFAASFDPSSSFTIVSGLSMATGANGTGPQAQTDIYGFDFYGKWKPLVNDHGWPFVSIQAEYMERDYEAAAQSLGSGAVLAAENLLDRGTYLQTMWGFKRRWVAGLRYDWAAGEGNSASDPLRDDRVRLSTDLTFFPTEFSKFRLQYNWDRADHLSSDESSLFFQFEFMYGAHGAHKF